jgi:hypothetical protein
VPKRIPATVVSRLRQTLRGRNALLHVFELWVGLAGIVSGIVYFYSPASLDGNAVSRTVGGSVAAVWIVGYAIAGTLIWYGLLKPSPRWEVVGLWLLGSATATNGIAIISVFAIRGVPSSATLIALTAAAWLRAMTVQLDVLRLADQLRGSAGDSG